jgi:ribonuclease Z
MRQHGCIVVRILAGAFFACGVPLPAAAQTVPTAPTLRVTLLGTGRPDPVMDRFGPSTLVEAGDERLLFDAGRGASQRLWQLKIPLGRVNALFLTHLHSDHTVGIPDLWLTGWLPTPFGRRVVPLEVWGPTGTRAMMSGLREAYAWDISVRGRQEGLPPAGIAVVTHEISQGVVFDRHGVKVTAFSVDHGGLLKPAFGYRVDYAGHSVVISGDTRYNENLIRFAAGADLLIHEVAGVRPELLAASVTAPTARRILGWHSSPEDAARVFERVHPKLAVFSHVVLLTTDAAIPPPTVADLLARTKAVYHGPILLGEDLMAFVIDDSVEVHPYALPSPPLRR